MKTNDDVLFFLDSRLCRETSALRSHSYLPAGVVGSGPRDWHGRSRLNAHYWDLCPRDGRSCEPMAPARCWYRWSHFWRWFVLLVRTPLSSGALLRWPLNRYPQFIARSEAFIKTYGAASVFLARFIAVVRAFVPLVAGILGMSSRRFFSANILSALIWAPAHVFPGVLLGMALNLAGLSTGRLAVLLIIGLVAVSAAVRALRSYLSWHPVLDRDAATAPRPPTI